MLETPRSAAAAPTRRLRVLCGAPFVPWPTTAYSHQVVQAKLAALATRHDVTFVCGVASQQDRANLEQLAAATRVVAHGVAAPSSRGRAARVWTHASSCARGLATGLPHTILKVGNAPLRRELSRLAASGQYGLVHIDYWYVGRGWIESCPTPSVCYVHDLMFERVARGQALAQRSQKWAPRTSPTGLFARGLREAELRTLSGFDALAAISPRDAEVLRALLPGKRVAPLPAGVDLSQLRPLGDAAEPFSVLFVGALTSSPNEDGAWAFARYVWPHVRACQPMARLYVVGSAPSQRLRALNGRNGVTVIGCVPDVRPWYERCGVVVSPLRWGSGMKGKVLEAMALARPLVATSVSIEGIAATEGEHYLGADTPAAFVAAIVRLFRDPDEGARLADAARHLVEERYGRSTCMQGFLDFLEEVADV